MNYRFKQCKDKLAIKIIQINENNSAFSLKKKAIKTNQFGNQEPECNDSVGNSNDEALEQSPTLFWHGFSNVNKVTLAYY